jgi:hypothetical protein
MRPINYILVALIVAISLGGIAPNRAEAFGMPTLSTVIGDIPQAIKEYGGDIAVNAAVNIAVAAMTKSITTWAASGFEGKPAFSQNLIQEVKKLEGDVLELGLNQIKINNVKLGGFLCGPFAQEINDALRVQIAVQKSFDDTQHSQCTVDKILKEAGHTIKDFESDFNNGGWPAWLELTTNPANNRFGLYITMQEELWSEQAEETEKKEKEIRDGSGFLSQKEKGECLKQIGEYEAEANARLAEDIDEEERGIIIQNMIDLQEHAAKDEGCVDRGPEKIVTAGKTIENALTKGLGLPADRLVVADEVGEMIGGVAQGFVLKMLEGARGLVGASQPKQGEKSLVDQLDEEGKRMEAELMAKANAAVDTALDNAKKVSEITDQLKELQDRYDLCLARLAAMGGSVTVNIDTESGDSSATLNDEEIRTQEAKCAEIKFLIEQKEAELSELLNSQAEASAAMVLSGTDPFPCRYLWESRPASAPVNWFSAGPVSGDTSGKQKGTSLAIPGDGTGFYKSYEINVDVRATTMSVQNGSVKILNFTPGGAKNYYNGAELGITDAGAGGLGKARYDNNAYAGGPKYFGNNRTSWTPNTNYHITIKYDAQAYSLYTKIVNKNSGQTVGEFTIPRALAGQDIACTSEQCHLTLVGEPGWSFSNMSVKMEPGGPFGSGMPGRCGL